MPASDTKPSRTVRRFASALLAALVVLGATAFAVAADVLSPGTGRSSDTSNKAGKVFQLSGGLNAPLVLGAAGQPINLKLTNPNPQTLHVSEMRVTVTGVSKAACSPAQFSVRQSGAAVAVPPRSAVVLSGDQRPRVSWTNSSSANQDPCVGVTLTFGYSGKGTLR